MLGRLFGKRSAESERARGDELFARGELGSAKLAYEGALDRVPASETAQREQLAERVRACLDGLARRRMAEAEALLQQGARELALQELQGAAEVAASAALKAEAEQRMERLERADARQHATIVEQSDDERWETLCGGFEQAQLDEYTFHGEPLRAALLALANGDAATARPVLERLAAEDKVACYLWFELGRARALQGDEEGAVHAWRTFLERVPEGAGVEARLVTHIELAALRLAKEGFEAACEEYEAAIDALPDDPRAYLAMAVFFRKHELPQEAIEVLQAASDALEGEQRPFRLTLELGLAHADSGHAELAIELLEEVVSLFVARQHLDLPPEGATRLAALHEQRGNAARALDIWSLLAEGSDVANHFDYHREAARLLQQLGHRADARRMLQRALELAPDDPAVRAELEQRLANLR